MSLKATAAAETQIGLGDFNAPLRVYVANRPPLDEYLYLDEVRLMRKGEIKKIADLTGNHWRKLFNVYAKFVYELQGESLAAVGVASWQEYRDQSLLQSGSDLTLLFSKPDLSALEGGALHIVMGKGFALDLGLPPLVWLNEHFAINKEQRIIVCPYFDYRQLSNVRIKFLVDLIVKEFPQWSRP